MLLNTLHTFHIIDKKFYLACFKLFIYNILYNRQIQDTVQQRNVSLNTVCFTINSNKELNWKYSVSIGLFVAFAVC